MKKVFFISMLAVAAIVACGKEDEEATPQVQEPQKTEQPTANDQITILKADEEGVLANVDGKDTLIVVGVPYIEPAVIKGSIVVKVGEGENVHDSIIYIYESKPIERDYTYDTITERIGDHDTTYTIPVPKQ
ncbi:MAG: hypothetical protein IK117_12295 [Bacteroidales bacterium]|nr:hypothetical protein [Bacteroidales bacterium]